jgi:hypothetical protein
MTPSDLLALHCRCHQQRLLLNFDGPFSQGLIEVLGLALRDHMRELNASQDRTMDVFSVYIEMTQNICHYIDMRGYCGEATHAALAISLDNNDRYVICSGNLVEADDGHRLMSTLADLATLDKTQLKTAYKTRLREARDPQAGRGAGLGLLDIASKAHGPLSATLTEQPAGRPFVGRSFFSLCSTI